MVVERILQSTADSEASSTGSGGGAAPPDALSHFEQQQQAQQQRPAAGVPLAGKVHGGLAAGVAALQASATSPRLGAAGAKRSTFSVAAAAEGTGVAAAPGLASPQQQQQQPGFAAAEAASGSPSATDVQPRQLWQGAAQHPQQEPGGEGEALQPADDPSGLLLLERLEQQAAANSSASSAGGVSKPPALATVAEDAVAAEASAQSRHEAAEVGWGLWCCCWAGWS